WREAEGAEGGVQGVQVGRPATWRGPCRRVGGAPGDVPCPGALQALVTVGGAQQGRPATPAAATAGDDGVLADPRPRPQRGQVLARHAPQEGTAHRVVVAPLARAVLRLVGLLHREQLGRLQLHGVARGPRPRGRALDGHRRLARARVSSSTDLVGKGQWVTYLIAGPSVVRPWS